MLGWGLIALSLFIAAIVLRPSNGAVIGYKLTLVSLAAVTGYHLDRSLFPYARPHVHLAAGRDLLAAAAQIRRAVIVAAAILAVSIGL
jgi:hypothetical protein